MKFSLFTHRYWFIASFVILVLWGVGKLIGHSFQQVVNLGNKPPDQVFTRIFRMPVPAGTSNIKVAGEAHMSGVFWMRFQTSNPNGVINSFKKNRMLSVGAPTTDINNLVVLHRQDAISKAQYVTVDWNNAFLVKNPECYKFSTIPFGTGWWGVLVVDRSRGVVYARGELL